MSTRSSILAFTAIAALGAAALASTAMAAAPGQNGNVHHGPGVQTPAPNFKAKPGLIGHDKITWSPQGPKKLIGGDPNTWTPKKKPLIGGDPNTWTPAWTYFHHHHQFWSDDPAHAHHDWRWWYARYQVVPVETTTTIVAPAVTNVTANCNCLTKEYLEDGSVLFKDLCTKEAAMATPDELKAQAQAPAPQVR
jgi:hypothetical protein